MNDKLENKDRISKNGAMGISSCNTFVEYDGIYIGKGRMSIIKSEIGNTLPFVQ